MNMQWVDRGSLKSENLLPSFFHLYSHKLSSHPACYICRDVCARIHKISVAPSWTSGREVVASCQPRDLTIWLIVLRGQFDYAGSLVRPRISPWIFCTLLPVRLHCFEARMLRRDNVFNKFMNLKKIFFFSVTLFLKCAVLQIFQILADSVSLYLRWNTFFF